MSPLGTSRTTRDVRLESAKWAKADIDQIAVTNRDFISTRPNLIGIHDSERIQESAPQGIARGPYEEGLDRTAVGDHEPQFDLILVGVLGHDAPGRIAADHF